MIICSKPQRPWACLKTRNPEFQSFVCQFEARVPDKWAHEDCLLDRTRSQLSGRESGNR